MIDQAPMHIWIHCNFRANEEMQAKRRKEKAEVCSVIRQILFTMVLAPLEHAPSCHSIGGC